MCNVSGLQRVWELCQPDFAWGISRWSIRSLICKTKPPLQTKPSYVEGYVSAFPYGPLEVLSVRQQVIGVLVGAEMDTFVRVGCGLSVSIVYLFPV